MPLAASYIELRQQIEDIRKDIHEILAAQNDINESTQKQLDTITTALAELQSSDTMTNSSTSYRPIGFIRPHEEEVESL